MAGQLLIDLDYSPGDLGKYQVQTGEFAPWKHLTAGKPYQEELEQAILRSRTVAVFVGPVGVTPWQNEEFRTALSAAVEFPETYRVIPALLPDADEGAIMPFLARRTWVDFRGGLDDPGAFAKRVAGVRGDGLASPSYGTLAEIVRKRP